jgi:nucleotide-binding universal stress UspA family protein
MNAKESPVITFKQILCPIDFSAPSRRALMYADAWASWYGAQLDVLHVVPGGDSDRRVQTIEPSSDDIEAEIRHVLGPVPSGSTSPTAHAATGRPHEVIVERARLAAADLIVMGTHGRSGVNRLLLGSVTEKVLRTAPCPVLTVPEAPSAARGAAVSLKRILCAIDFSPSALKALKHALDLGRQADGRVTVLYALEYLDPEEPCEHVDFDIRRRRQHFIDHARQRLHTQLAEEPQTWCEIEEVVAIDRAYKAVLQRAAETPTDLIVMGAQGMSGLELMVYG